MEYLQFSLDVDLLTWLLLALCALSAIYILAMALPRIGCVLRLWKSDNRASLDEVAHYPGVSVVIYANNASHNLATLVDSIVNQDYPAPVEVVIAVDESNMDPDARVITNALQQQYPSVTATYVPQHSHNLSRKKLAITLGIKASHQPVVLITDGLARISSHKWIRHMARHFASGADVVIGYASIRGAKKETPRLGRLDTFDVVRNGVRFLSSAIAGHPYRGCGANIAYRRDLFFNHKGFAEHLNLRYGDDDIFIYQLACHHERVEVEIASEARVRLLSESPGVAHSIDWHRHCLTRRYLPAAPFLLWGSISVAWWLWLLSAIALCVVTYPNMLGVAAVTVVSLVLCIPTMLMWKRACVMLQARRLMLTTPWLALIHPLYHLRYWSRSQRRSESQYTWSPHDI